MPPFWKRLRLQLESTSLMILGESATVSAILSFKPGPPAALQIMNTERGEMEEKGVLLQVVLTSKLGLRSHIHTHAVRLVLMKEFGSADHGHGAGGDD